MKKLPLQLNRRAFLKGAGALGAASLALPILPSLANTQETNFPKRLVIFMSGNGTIADNWTPQSTDGYITEMSTILEPLDRHRDDLIVFEGLDILAGLPTHQARSGFHAHERGLGAILTGTGLAAGDMEARSGYARGISIDQYIANGMAGETGLHSLQVGLVTRRHGRGWYNRDTMTYAAPEQPIFYESDGARLFTKIFGEDIAQAETYARTQSRRRSILDFLKDDLASVERRLSSEDRQRLEQHHTAFRELETQLEEPAPSCGDGEQPTLSNWLDASRMDPISEFQINQTVQALACDRTRVATLQYGKGLGAVGLQPIGRTGSWHAYSHEGDSNQEARQILTEVNRYIATRFAHLLDEMKAIPEGDGTLLDNSVVLWVNELGKGNNHDFHDAPVVIAGNLQGFFETGGRHVTVGLRAHNDLLMTLAHGFGHTEMTEFGIPELCSGVIEELLA